MKPYYQDNHIKIFNKDCRSMDELPDESVQCVVTSPPYWGLRKYSGEQELVWGGDNHCEHKWGEKIIGDTRAYGAGLGQWQDGSAESGRPHYKVSQGNFCSLCGAWKGAFGLEPAPEMYVQHTIEILREIRRVLRKDGVVFWNIGDSYWGGQPHKAGETNPGKEYYTKDVGAFGQVDKSVKHGTLKPKDLCLIPFRIAIAAQEDGWWVRSVIIWSKKNPMPESVKDRPTESHEYILMLTKSAKYYWDQEAVREKANPETQRSKSVDAGIANGNVFNGDRRQNYEKDRHTVTARNIRTVWEFPTQPYPEAHFAVFPKKLPETCIKAATPEVGCCSKCGAPWKRVLEKKPSEFNIRVRDAKAGRATPEEGYKATQEEIERYPGNHPDPGYSHTIGWQPTCKRNAPRVPSIVLDPLMGAGTTLLVAKNLNRLAMGYELSGEYCQLAVERCRQQVLG